MVEVSTEVTEFEGVFVGQGGTVDVGFACVGGEERKIGGREWSGG